MIKYKQDKVLKIEFIKYGCCYLCECDTHDMSDFFKLQIADFKVEICEDCLRKLHLLTLI